MNEFNIKVTPSDGLSIYYYYQDTETTKTRALEAIKFGNEIKITPQNK